MQTVDWVEAGNLAVRSERVRHILRIIERALRRISLSGASQAAQVVKNLPGNEGNMRFRLDPWVRKIP